MFVFSFFTRRYQNYKRKTVDSAQIVWENVFKGGVFALVAALVVWLSVFLYIAFYYYYMPSVSHTRQVNLKFKACEKIPFQNETGRCSYPSAHVQLTKLQQLLMIGQTYRIYLKLEMPESPANIKLGMFMVCAQLADKDGLMVANSCRSTMLHYRSQLLSVLTTLTFYPMMVFGNAEEKQTITLELYSHFEEDKNHPVTDVYVELQAHTVEFYSASIHIQAHLTGLRYLMFHWPLLSASLGISSNLFFIIFIASVSWWQVYGPRDEYGNRILYPRLGVKVPGRNLFMGDLDYQPDDDDGDFVEEDNGSGSERSGGSERRNPFTEKYTTERRPSRSMIMELRRSGDGTAES